MPGSWKIEDVVLKDRGKVEPLLVTFSNGKLNQNTDTVAQLFQSHSETHLAKHDRRVLTVDTGRLQYGGKNFADENSVAVKEQIFLGVLNKDTGGMKLVELSDFNVYPFGLDLKSKSTISETPTYVQMQERIAEDFGSKKARIYALRKRQYRVNAEEMTAAVEQAAATADIHEEVFTAEQCSSFEDILPARDIKASSVAGVYSLDTIIQKHELDLLKEQAEKVLHDPEESDKYSLLLRNILATAKLGVGGNSLEKACIALYIEHIIKYLSMKQRTMNFGKFKLPGCPKEIARKIISEFSEGPTYRRVLSRKYVDKAICYILVLGFITNLFQLEMNCIMESLSIDKLRLQQLAAVVGATFNKGTYILKLPLNQLKRLKKNTKRFKRK